jgi:hypothetical protein
MSIQKMIMFKRGAFNELTDEKRVSCLWRGIRTQEFGQFYQMNAFAMP